MGHVDQVEFPVVPHPREGRGAGEVEAVAAGHHERRPPEHLGCVGDVMRTFAEVYFLKFESYYYVYITLKIYILN